MNKRLIGLVVSLGLAGGTSLWAHHSLAAEFDQKKPVSLTGTLTKLDWRNPHAWIYIDVKNASGGIDKWECELGSPNAMTRAGFTQDSVKVGDELVLDGILSKKAPTFAAHDRKRQRRADGAQPNRRREVGIHMKFRLILAAVVSLACATWIVAQPPQGGPGAGKGKGGKSAAKGGFQPPEGPAPKTPWGVLDLNGVWQRPYVPDIERANGGPLPYTEWGKKQFDTYNAEEGDYTGSCLPFGHSRAMGSPDPIQIMLNADFDGVPDEQKLLVQGVPDRRPRAQPEEGSDLVWRFGRPLGRRHHGRRHHQFQRLHAAGYQRASAERPVAHDREIYARPTWATWPTR